GWSWTCGCPARPARGRCTAPTGERTSWACASATTACPSRPSPTADSAGHRTRIWTGAAGPGGGSATRASPRGAMSPAELLCGHALRRGRQYPVRSATAELALVGDGFYAYLQRDGGWGW